MLIFRWIFNKCSIRYSTDSLYLINGNYLKCNSIIKKDDFTNVIKKDPQVQIKINDLLDRYIKLP